MRLGDILWLAILALTAGALGSVPGSGVVVGGSSVQRRQTSRQEILRRAAASRTRPKRAKFSPGLPPPTTPQQRFVIRFTGTGQDAVDQTYAWSDPANGAGFFANYGGTLAQAPVFYLNSGGYLVRDDVNGPMYAYAPDATGGGTGFVGYRIRFTASNTLPAPENGYFVKCSIATGNNLLTCAPDHAGTQQTVTQACFGAGYSNALALILQGNTASGCVETFLLVSSAVRS